MDKLTQITLAWNLFQQGLLKVRIARHLGRNREMIIRWIRCPEVRARRFFTALPAGQ